MRVSIVGASGYTGGELLRLLLFHPCVEITQVTSERHAGEYVYQQHPNLRKRTRLQFSSRDALEPCDVLFLALPHGEAQRHIAHYRELAPRIIDLSADFRLRDAVLYRRWYGEDHLAPQLLGEFVYGLPELHRAEMREARYISGVGCNATAAILALWPLVRADLIDCEQPIIVDVKTGSSEGGARANPGSHHPEKSHSTRMYAPTGHRHNAEVIQELGLPAHRVHVSMTAVDMVRGVLAAAHVFVREGATLKDLWRAYRAAYSDEPFVRIVKDRTGIYRMPDPKILAGSNYADVGFDLDPDTRRVVSLAAIDNLMKGAAGSAVQSMNIMCGFDEMIGLEFPGLHPV
jgi:N-acetyl-gamma-glutamyl-phosphate/LysW-gamma-L-alpha-aminoadipyl-6-phosphate reductase